MVQCPSCRSRFRIADDKVTDRGVRVRCTSCKSVFQVKKPGAADGAASAPAPGSTVEISALDGAALARPTPRNVASAAAPAPRARAQPAAARRVPLPPPPPLPPPGTRSLDADDLFGMSELTGDAPLQDFPAPPPRPPTSLRPAAPRADSPPARPAPQSSISFDDIELEVDDAPSPPRPPTAPVAPRPQAANRPRPAAAQARPAAMVLDESRPAAQPPPPPEPDPAPPPPPPDDHDGEEPSSEGSTGSVRLGAFKTVAVAAPPITMQDPFEGLNLGEGARSGDEEPVPPEPLAKEKERAPAASVAKLAPPPAEESEPQAPVSTPRDLVSSALTGLVGAALAIAVLLGAAVSDDSANGWFGFGASSELVATRVVSGLYDTVAGKPVFYVRGRVENRGRKVRGPVKIVAELVSDSGTEAHGEAIAGAEPSAEDVWSLHNGSEADKLGRALDAADAQRHVAPGASLPFFAFIAEPPADLDRHKLRVRVEPLDAWVPQAPLRAGDKGR